MQNVDRPIAGQWDRDRGRSSSSLVRVYARGFTMGSRDKFKYT